MSNLPQLTELIAAFHNALDGQSLDFAGSIVPRHGIDNEVRLNIYRSSVRGIQTDALQAIYPVINALTGERFFRAMAQRYLIAHPSTSGDLHQLGDRLSDFLVSFGPAQALPYLPDVARLEWSWHRAFHAADTRAFDFAKLAQLPAEQQAHIKFALSPGTHLIASDYPIHLIWQANQSSSTEDDAVIELKDTTVALVIFRHGFDVVIESVGKEIFTFLTDVQKQETLEALARSHAIDKLLVAAIECSWIDHFYV